MIIIDPDKNGATVDMITSQMKDDKQMQMKGWNLWQIKNMSK